MNYQKYFDWSITALRVSLGIIFLWFGLLKFSSNPPVFELINATFPIMASSWGGFVLATFETILGILLIFNLFPIIVNTLLVLHMLGTFSTFIVNPGYLFDPGFPMLNMEGEFVIKNLTLITASLVIIFYEQLKRQKQSPIL